MKKQRRWGRRVLALFLCSVMCLTQVELPKAATLSEGDYELTDDDSDTVDDTEDTGTTGQYESDASGNPEDVAEGTSRYYTEYITYTKTVFISSQNKVQYIPVQIKEPYTNLTYVTYDDSKGVDEEGYRWLSHCKVSLLDSTNKVLEGIDTIEENDSDSSYKAYLNLTPGKYNISVLQWLEPYGDDGYQRLVEGYQTVEYTVFHVVDRQATDTTDSSNSLKDNTSGTTTDKKQSATTNTSQNTVTTSKDTKTTTKTTATKAKKSIKVTKLKVKKKTKKITGKTNKKALVTVTVNGKKYKAKANTKGVFTVRLPKKLKKNTKVKIKVTLKGYKTYQKTVKVK